MGSGEEGGRTPFLPAPTYAATVDAGLWVVRDLLPVGGKLSFYAPAKTGKSFAALQLAGAIADPNQTRFLDFPVDLHGPVLYLQLDTSSPLWKVNYVRNLMSGKRGIDLSNVYMADRMMDDVPTPFQINGSGGAWLRKEVDRLQPVAVVFDTVRNTHLLKESDSTEMTIMVEATMAAVAPAAVVWIAHPRKGNDLGREDMVDDTRGSSAFNAAVDVIAKLTPKRFAVKGRTNRTEDQFAEVYQDDDGFWCLVDNRQEKFTTINEILVEMAGAKKKDIETAIAIRLNITTRSVRRLVKELEEGRQS